MRRLMRHRTAAALLIGVGVFVVLFGLRSAGFLESLELGAYDNLLRLRPTTTQKPVVTHVWVTEEEIRVLGHPMQDRTMAKVLRKLLEHSPRAIGIDIFRDVPTGTGWDVLARCYSRISRSRSSRSWVTPAIPACPVRRSCPTRDRLALLT